MRTLCIAGWNDRGHSHRRISVVSLLLPISVSRVNLRCCSLHLIPGSTSSLQRISVGGENLLLIYEDGRVRLWDVQTTEFWRSTSVDKAEELIAQGGWTEL